MRETPTNRETIQIVRLGYYINHGRKREHVCKMRLDVALHTFDDDKGGTEERVQIHLLEAALPKSGWCETNIALTIPQAEELLDVLLDITKYVLPEDRKRNRPD